jgi:hypothetical protein
VLNALQSVLLLLHLLTRSVSRGRDTNDSEYSGLKGAPFSASAVASAECISFSLNISVDTLDATKLLNKYSHKLVVSVESNYYWNQQWRSQ